MSNELTPLEALENIRQLFIGSPIDISQQLDIIENELKDYENLKLAHRSMQDAVLDDFKKLKALEIIKEKDVNVYWLKRSPNLSYYNYGVDVYESLIQEEYDFLKEVLL